MIKFTNKQDAIMFQNFVLIVIVIVSFCFYYFEISSKWILLFNLLVLFLLIYTQISIRLFIEKEKYGKNIE